MVENIHIEEYDKSSPLDLNNNEYQFINQRVNKEKVKKAIAIDYQYETKKFILTATSFVGVLQLPTNRYRIQIDPKIPEINLFKILRYTYETNFNFYDNAAEYQEGRSYLDIVALLFKRGLEGVISKGLYKTYINEEDNIKYLKGKLLLATQIRTNILKKDRFYCSYDELSYDNLENQVLLCAIEILINIVQDRQLKKDLLILRQILLPVVTSKKIKPFELNNIHFTRLNEYYKNVIELAGTIIRGVYLDNLTVGNISAFSFLVDMNEVFEKFICKIIQKEVFKGETNYSVEPQKRVQNLVTPEDVTVKPDILIRDLKSNKVKVVIDTKYKQNSQNSDFYQILSYSLAFKTEGVLLYPEHNIDSRDYTINNPDVHNKIYIRTIDLKFDCDFKQYIEVIRKELKQTIKPFLEMVNV